MQRCNGGSELQQAGRRSTRGSVVKKKKKNGGKKDKYFYLVFEHWSNTLQSREINDFMQNNSLDCICAVALTLTAMTGKLHVHALCIC